MEETAISSPERFAGYVHSHLGAQIGQFDAKVTIILGLSTGALAFMLKDTGDQALLDSVTALISNPVVQLSSPWRVYSAAACFVLLIFSFTCALMCLSPRLSKSKQSLVYFRGITKIASGEDYANLVAGSDKDQLLKSVLQDAFALARIARRKAFYAGAATTLLTLGLIALIVYVATQAL